MEPPAKRPRLDAPPAAEAAPVDSCAQVALVVGGAVFPPLFTHQQFPAGLHAAYSLRLEYSDPDLRLRASLLRNEEKSEDSACAGAGAAPVPPPRPLPELHAALKLSLPDGYPLPPLVAPGAATPPFEGPWFPPVASVASGEGAVSTWAPPGRLLSSYDVPGGSGGRFTLRHWKLEDDATRDYHDRMATLGMWLIETASPIDLHDPKWEVLGLYKETPPPSSSTSPPSYAFVGYATVYSFVRPQRSSEGGGLATVLRLGQAVVLPPYQRQGHGAALLRGIHALAEERRAAEVTVESPCEGMARLRDALDVTRAVEAGLHDQLPPLPEAGTGKGVPVTPPPAALHAAARKALRVTPAQAHRALEALTLVKLVAALPASSSWEEASTPFRLAVKRRIFTTDDGVSSIPDPEQRKEVLQEEYETALAQYLLALRGAARLLAPGGVSTSDGACSAAVALPPWFAEGVAGELVVAYQKKLVEQQE